MSRALSGSLVANPTAGSCPKIGYLLFTSQPGPAKHREFLLEPPISPQEEWDIAGGDVMDAFLRTHLDKGEQEEHWNFLKNLMLVALIVPYPFCVPKKRWERSKVVKC